MTIYFAGAIRAGRDDWALYRAIVQRLREYGEVLTEHVAAERLTAAGEPMNDRAIHDRDLQWLRRADVLVAEVTTPSLGVGYEVGKATLWSKPVLCLFRPDSGRALSGMIAGCADVITREYRAVEELDEIFPAFFLRVTERIGGGPRCSHCGRGPLDVRVLVEGTLANICDRCVTEMHTLLASATNVPD